MAKTHPAYPPAFRAEAVELARTSGKGVPQLAQELGISEQALRGWMKRADVDAFRRFFWGMLHRGHYFAPSAFEAGFVSLAHTDADIDATVGAAGVVMPSPG